MKKNSLKLLCLIGILTVYNFTYAQDALKLHYTFEHYDAMTVNDETANDYDATLANEASIKKVGDFYMLDLGVANGYLDLGTKTGTLIGSLESFTVATYIFIDEKTNLESSGNFIFSFANYYDMHTQADGNMFLSAKSQRYAISPNNWVGENGNAVQVGVAMDKGEWKHIAYIQNVNVGTLYVDGIEAATAPVGMYPKALGNTTYNYIGRSCYTGDSYLKNTLLTDFRIYNTALSAAEIGTLANKLEAIQQAYADVEMEEAKEALIINGGEEDVIQNLILPTTIGNSVAVSWASDKEQYIATNGKVTRPAVGSAAETVKLTATLSKNGNEVSKEFTLKALPFLDDQESVNKDSQTLEANWSEACVRERVVLPRRGLEGSVITWKSDNPDYITNEGAVLKLMPKGTIEKMVSLTATLTKNDKSTTKKLEVCIEEDEGFSAYLFAYFTGNTGNEEAIRFAISSDGFNYKSLNGNNPIIGSDTISDKGGVRDPHILRGVNDGYYYMVVTDMKSSEGWSNNHGIILLRSNDLINWTHSRIDFKARYPQDFGTIQSAWAPQTFYDAEAGKYMIYWSMRSPGVHERIYYAYANADFTDIEAKPQVLYDHPDQKSTIDGDIIYKDGKYNLFFKTEGDGNGIKKAVSDRLTGGYVLQDKYLQQTTQAVEGSCVYKLINTDTYILMYDVYNNGRYEFTESKDLENFTAIHQNLVSMDFHPRHGTTIPITEEEGKRLMQKWGGSNTLDVYGSNSEAVRTRNIMKSGTTIFLPVKQGTDLSNFNPELSVFPDVQVSPNIPQDFTKGAITYTLSYKGSEKKFTVTAEVNNNPVLDGYYADPEVMYSEKTKRYYIYPTTDGSDGWASSSFKTFSSADLVTWVDEGEILVLGEDVLWANRNAWAPCIIERKVGDDEYKYYYYFTAAQQIGVAVSNNPTGPFIDSGKALINTKPSGVTGGQEIDPDVFQDPVSGKYYIYWGNGYCAMAELNDDMISIKEGTAKRITLNNTFREGIYVFYRDGKYYFFWSEGDTGSENYKVRYGTSDSPTGTITIPTNNIVIQKDATKKIYGTGHCSVLQIPDKDEWYIVYHRFGRPRLDPSGYRREVCIDKLEFNEDGSVKQTSPTLEGVNLNGDDPNVGVEQFYKQQEYVDIFFNTANSTLSMQSEYGITSVRIFNLSGQQVFYQKLNGLENAYTLDLNQLASGSYIIDIQLQEGKYSVNKIIK